MENTTQNIVFFCIAASLGALCRYGLGMAITALLGRTFPWGIFIINVIGCFAFGVVWALIHMHHVFSPTFHTILLTGFMGAFTTFSSFIFDANALLKGEQWLAFAGNIVGQVALGLLLLWAGIKCVVLVYQ